MQLTSKKVNILVVIINHKLQLVQKYLIEILHTVCMINIDYFTYLKIKNSFLSLELIRYTERLHLTYQSTSDCTVLMK